MTNINIIDPSSRINDFNKLWLRHVYASFIQIFMGVDEMYVCNVRFKNQSDVNAA